MKSQKNYTCSLMRGYVDNNSPDATIEAYSEQEAAEKYLDKLHNQYPYGDPVDNMFTILVSNDEEEWEVDLYWGKTIYFYEADSRNVSRTIDG